MPSGDRTGPAGFGPMTGRGFGRCAGYSTPGFARGRGRGMGIGGGWGRGRGMGRGFGAFGRGRGAPGLSRVFPSAAETREDLATYRDQLKRELTGVEEALSKEKPQ